MRNNDRQSGSQGVNQPNQDKTKYQGLADDSNPENKQAQRRDGQDENSSGRQDKDRSESRDANTDLEDEE